MAVERHRGVDRLLEPVHVGGEGGNHDPALAAREDVLEHRPHGRLRGRRSDTIGVRRVATQEQQPLAAELGKASGVGGRAVHRRLVELVVARDQDRAQLALEGHRAGVRDRMRDVDQLNVERAGFQSLARLDLVHLDVLKLLIDRGGDVTSVTVSGSTALHLAASAGDEESTKYLLQRGANRRSKTLNGLTPLDLAAGKGHVGVISLLLDDTIPLEEQTTNRWMAIHYAAVKSQQAAARILFERA